MNKRFLMIMAAASLLGMQAAAGNIDTVVRNILANNPEIKSQLAANDLEMAQMSASNNLPDPSIEGEYLFSNKKTTDNRWALGVTQEFEWPGVYSARALMNEKRTLALNYALEAKRMEVFVAARELCVEIAAANKQIKFQQDIYNYVKNLYDASMRGLQHGEISILDTNKLRIELLNAEQAIEKYRAVRQEKIDELSRMNNREAFAVDVESISEYPADELAPLSDYISEAAAQAPELRYLAQQMAVADEAANVAKQEGKPSFTVGYRTAREEKVQFNGLQVGVSIPIFSTKNKAKAAMAQKHVSSYSHNVAASNIQAEVTRDYNNAKSKQHRLAGYRAALENVNNVEMLNKALAGGQITVLNYIQEMRYFIEAHAELINVEQEYHTLLNTLNKYRDFAATVK